MNPLYWFAVCLVTLLLTAVAYISYQIGYHAGWDAALEKIRRQWRGAEMLQKLKAGQ